MPLPLESKRLILRHFRDSDLDQFVAYRSDPLVARFQGWNVPYDRETGQKFLDEMKNAQPGQAGAWFQAAIESKANGELLGDCAFHIMASDHRQAYLGITIAQPNWKNGYGEEACRRLLDFLFLELKLHRVVAECDILNQPSLALLDKLGFRREAELIENIWFKGTWGSEFHYALLEREWKNQ